MKTHQARVNARAIRRDTRADALSLAAFLAKGLVVLALTFSVLTVFDEVAELSQRTVDRILAPSEARD